MITLLPSSAALNIANTAPVVHVRQNPARKPIETAQPRSRVALIEASFLCASLWNPDAELLLTANTNAGTTLRQVAFDKSVQRQPDSSILLGQN